MEFSRDGLTAVHSGTGPSATPAAFPSTSEDLKLELVTS